jgi:hypothetical protein
MPYKDPEQEKEYNRKWRQKNKVKLNAYQKEWSDKHPGRKNEHRQKFVLSSPEKCMLAGAKNRCKTSGLALNIDISDIVIPLVCPILGIPIYKEITGKTGPKHASPSLDRIDNTKGYIKGNVQVISNKSNTMKGNSTPEERINFALWVLATDGKELYEIRKIS